MKVILVDDEILALNYLEYQLKSVADVEIIGKYTDPLIGKQAIEEADVDLVFLDIEMHKTNGMQLAEELLEIKPHLPIVFVTAYNEYAIKAFELNALDYILKPATQERLRDTLKRVTNRVESKNEEIDTVRDFLSIKLFKQVSFVKYTSKDHFPITLKWRTKKAEQLFLYLLVHHDKLVDKAILVELLWPDLELERAYQQLYSAVYHIRNTLAELHHFFSITSLSSGYMLNVKHTNIDVEKYDHFMQSAINLSNESISLYEDALGIITGEYLEEYDFIWAETNRQRYRVHWIDAALKVIQFYDEEDNYDRGLAIANELVKRYPLEEEVYFYLMKLNSGIGHDLAVKQFYTELKTMLYKEDGAEPGDEVQQWYNAWLKNK